MTVPDFELLKAWRAGDNKAGGELFERHFESIARFFRNKVNDGVEDMIQKTFLACVEGKERFRGDSSFRTYLFAIAHNVLRRQIRTKVRHGHKIDFGVTSMHDLGPGPSTVMAKRKEQQILLAALRQVPLDFQVALELYYWEKMTAAQIGTVLDVPEGTARSRIRRGKEILHQRIAELAESPQVLQTTLTNLEDWAKGLRNDVLGQESKQGTR